MKNLLNEPGRQKLLQLLTNRPAFQFVKAPQALLHRLGVGSDVKGVLGDLPRYARHVRGDPREDVCVGTDKVNEHHILFVVEGSNDLQRLTVGGVRIEGYVFGTLGKLEATRVSLRGVHGFVRHLLQVGGEGLIHSKGFGVLDTIDIALVGVLE